ncbi:hypothetical protein [Streptomyces marianii]|uniref:Uncharacterized protein n=1 Tax=Streptomyces marianii TaxID=1817406 RepID=A0A5R9DU18_9ACTN|nr:hypothetical protein [Streptomyces marianii]TLQ39238.1 hypothetical protein FEF34_38215 [Streptomyces marianii]
MKDEEAPAPALTPAAVRRRFTAAAWGSAVAWPILTAAVTPLLLWWLDMGWDEVMSAGFAAAGLLPLAPVLVYVAVDAARTVRKEQREVAESARELVSAVRAAGDRRDLSLAAHHLGTTMLGASTAFNTRVLPRRTTRAFARRVMQEADGDGLSPSSLDIVKDLARMTA